MFVINLAIKTATKIWDTLNVTVAEQEQKITELKSSYEALQSEYDTLSKKQDITDAEKRRLEYLERRLELDERILKAEQAQLFDEKTGNKFTDYFDKDNLNTQYENETSRRNGSANKEGFEYLSANYERNTENIDDIHEQIAAMEELQDKYEESSRKYERYQSIIDDLQNKETKYLKNLSDSETQLTINLGKCADNIEYLQDQIASGDLTDSQLEVAKEQLAKWTDLYTQTDAMIEDIQKRNGTFDYNISSVIDGALNKVQFTGIKTSLEELGEQGSLSVETITKKFPELINYLDESGVSAKDLVEYLKMLSDHDYLNIDYVKGQLRQNYQNNYAGYDAVYAGNDWDRYIGSKSNEEIKILYSIMEDTSVAGWSFEDFDAELRKRQDSSIEVDTEIKSFNPTVLSGSIETLSKISSLYTDFANSIENETNIHFEIPDVESFRESLVQTSEQAGITAESFDRFERVLTSSESSADDIQRAFNLCASEFIVASEALDGLTSSTRDQVITQLELQGIVNASEVITEEFASVMEEAKDKSIDLTNATYEEINGLIAEGTYSEDTINKLYAYAIQKQLANENALDTSADIANLLALCQQLNIAGEALVWFNRLKSLQTQAENGATGALFDSQLANAKQKVKEFALEAANVGATVVTAPKNTGGGGGSKASDAKKKAEDTLNEILEYYQTCLDNGYISLGDWLGKSKDAINSYYTQGKIDADDYFNHLKDLAEHLKDVYDGVADTVSGVLDDAIDGLKDQMDALDDSKDSVESKYEAEITYWKKQKENLQDEIDFIEKANEKRKNAIDLQDAMWKRKQAENQRTRLTYVEGHDGVEGQMVYLNDPKAVRETQEEVADAEYKIQLQKLNDTLDEYTKKIEIIEKQRDNEIDGIERQREALQKQIDEYEKYKQKWADVTTSLEDEYEKQYAAAVLGADWEAQVLAGRTDVLNKFATDYAAIQDNIRYYTAKGAETENVIPLGLQNLPTDLSLISAGISTPVNEILNGMDGVTNAANSIDTSNVATQASNISTGLQPACQSISDTTQKFQELSDKISNYSIPEIDSSNLVTSFETVRTQLSEFADEFQSLCDQLTNSWSAFIGAINGGASGGGNGDPLAGGLDNDISSYASLFNPLFDSMDAAESTFTQKLTEWAETWSTAKNDISSIIGVGGGASSSGTSGSESKGKSDKKSGEKSDGKSSGSKADSLVGAVEAGGQSIATSFEETWTPALVDMGNYINEWCQKVIDMFNEMADKAIRDAAAAIDAAKEAAKASDGDVSGLSSAGAYTGHAFATGTKGLSKDEPHAIVSEYGQKETTLLPDGRVIKTNSPTEMSLPKGSVIFNEEQTKKLEENGKKAKISGKAYANGTDDGVIITKDGHVLRPLQPGDRAYDLMKKFEPLVEKWQNGEEVMINNALIGYQKQMENMYRQLTTTNVVNNNQNVQPVTIQFGDINLTGVQNVDAFANEINRRFPSKMLQELYRR